MRNCPYGTKRFVKPLRQALANWPDDLIRVLLGYMPDWAAEQIAKNIHDLMISARLWRVYFRVFRSRGGRRINMMIKFPLIGLIGKMENMNITRMANTFAEGHTAIMELLKSSLFFSITDIWVKQETGLMGDLLMNWFKWVCNERA